MTDGKPPRRRSAGPIDAEKFFERVTFGALDWPGRTTHLQPDSVVAQRNRAVSPNVSVAELYHENSKLFPAMLSSLTAFRTDAAAVRRTYMVRRAAGWVESNDRPSAIPPPTAAGLLRAVRDTADMALFFAVELRAAVEHDLWFYEPVNDQLTLVKDLSDVSPRLRQALGPLNAEQSEVVGAWHVLVVGSFARNATLFGERGYRRTLLEAGRVIELLGRQASAMGLGFSVLYEFADRSVDDVAEVDGVDEGCVAVLEIWAKTQ